MNSESVFAVGSENPVKIGCVAESVRQYCKDARVVGVPTSSGVSHQPVSDEEMLTGALNRARQAIDNLPEAGFGVGIEGGVLDTHEGMWAYAWVVIIDRAGSIGMGQTGRFLLPEGVAILVRDGMELGDADDHFFGRSNSKQNEGAIGILSDNRVTRLELYRPAVTFALLRFIHPEFYQTIKPGILSGDPSKA
ncbi:MAG: inosine/xanthosine triphosphatase [Acidobacteria bacterium]|nr:inosine/xanthosine triphosphatase [Acidobacteriota bacterium]